jgi:hypothetical protein
MVVNVLKLGEGGTCAKQLVQSIEDVSVVVAVLYFVCQRFKDLAAFP